MCEAEALFDAAQASLERGRWQDAHDAFLRVLERGESPQAYFGLAGAVWWLGDMPETVRCLEKAYRGFQERGDTQFAAASALRLAFHAGLHLKNPAVGAGWLARAARLIDEHELAPLRGELLVTRACLELDPKAATETAGQALALGREARDPDLELCARAMLGAALVEQGRIAEGIAELDEAMARCLGGEPKDVGTVAFASCLTLVACTSCADFVRARQWLRALQHFVEEYGSPFHAAECRLVHADLLFAAGDWEAAERELLHALELSGDRLPSHRADALAALAELKLSRGLLEEAEHLLADLEPSRRSVPVRCRLELLRENYALAATLAERRLELIGHIGLESGRLLELLGEAEIARQGYEKAIRHGSALVDLASLHRCQILVARGTRLHGHALLRAGDPNGRRDLDRALDGFARLDMPYEAARTRYVLAAATRGTNPELSASEARAALAAFDKLGASLEADAAAALLRGLGVRTARRNREPESILTRREQQVLDLLAEGLSNPAIAQRLHVSRKTVEHHVAHVLDKLGLKSRAEAAARALRTPRSRG